MRESCRILRYLDQSYIAPLSIQTHAVVLHNDSTADETHGYQQLRFFNAHYDHNIYHPLMVFDGVSGQLITAMLCPGNALASLRAPALLRRIIIGLKQRLPYVPIIVRADSGFCSARLLEELERLDGQYGDIDYLIGLGKNPVLLRLAEPTIAKLNSYTKRAGRPSASMTVSTTSEVLVPLPAGGRQDRAQHPG